MACCSLAPLSCFRFETHVFWRDRDRALMNWGIATESSTPMMRITIMTSTSVKPRDLPPVFGPTYQLSALRPDSSTCQVNVVLSEISLQICLIGYIMESGWFLSAAGSLPARNDLEVN